MVTAGLQTVKYKVRSCFKRVTVSFYADTQQKEQKKRQIVNALGTTALIGGTLAAGYALGKNPGVKQAVGDVSNRVSGFLGKFTQPDLNGPSPGQKLNQEVVPNITQQVPDPWTTSTVSSTPLMDRINNLVSTVQSTPVIKLLPPGAEPKQHAAPKTVSTPQRKAGEALSDISIVTHPLSYKKILSERDYNVLDPETGLSPLFQRLHDVGSASVGSSELKEILSYAGSPKKTAALPTTEKLRLIGDYLSANVEKGAPLIIPVQNRETGVRGASIIDADRLISFGLRGPSERSSELLFIPGSNNQISHVLENVVDSRDNLIPYLATMSVGKARSIYNAAQKMGYKPASGILEELNPIDAVAGGGVVTRHLASQGVSRPPFLIVPSKGSAYDIKGMREGTRTLATARLPHEPGWLGNPYKAVDAGGPHTRQEATRLFGALVEQKAQDPNWRNAFLGLAGKQIGYYKPDEEYIHLHALQDWIARNAAQV